MEEVKGHRRDPSAISDGASKSATGNVGAGGAGGAGGPGAAGAGGPMAEKTYEIHIITFNGIEVGGETKFEVQGIMNKVRDIDISLRT